MLAHPVFCPEVPSVFAPYPVAVKGAGAGIDPRFAQTTATKGAAVAAVDLDIVTATETAEMITAAGGSAASYQADGRNPPELIVPSVPR